MASTVRTMLLLAIPAAAIGVLGGLVLRSMEPGTPESPPVAADPGGESPGRAPPRDRPRTRSRLRAGDADGSRAPRSHRRVVGDQREGVTPLDPSWARRLSDPDEGERHRCAFQLLRMGPEQLGAVELLEPPDEVGRELRDRVANALAALAAIEEHEDYPRLPESERLDVRIKYWREVVPESYFVTERKKLWSDRVAGDANRVAMGTIPEGQAAWHELELALARLELGEIGVAEWRKLREARIDAARGWCRELAARPDVGRDMVKRVEDALDRIERR